MEIQQLMVGIIFLVFGGLNVIQPKILLNFQIWTQKVIMGAQYILSQRTFTAIRILGAIFLILGAVLIFGSTR